MRHDLVKTFYFAKKMSAKDENYEVVSKYVEPLIKVVACEMPINDYISINTYGTTITRMRRLIDDVGQMRELSDDAEYGVWTDYPTEAENVILNGKDAIAYNSPTYLLDTPIVKIGNVCKCDIRRVLVDD